MRQALAGLVMVVVVTFGVASATSLGVFDDVALSGVTASPCTASEIKLFDDTLGGLVDLVAAPLSSLDALSEIDTIRLSGLSGDCDLATPIVAVSGLDLVSGGGEQILLVEELDRLPVGASADIDITLENPISVSALLYDLTSAEAALCPAGAPCS